MCWACPKRRKVLRIRLGWQCGLPCREFLSQLGDDLRIRIFQIPLFVRVCDDIVEFHIGGVIIAKEFPVLIDDAVLDPMERVGLSRFAVAR